MSLDLVLLAKEIQRPIRPGATTVLITRILAYVILMGPKGPRSLLVFSVRSLLPEALKNGRYTMPRNSIDYSIMYRVLQTQLDATITIMQ